MDCLNEKVLRAVLQRELPWYWMRYATYPVTCVIAHALGCTHLVPHLLAATFLRYLVNLFFTFLSKLDSFAEPRRISKANPAAKQHERELDWDGPLILSPAAFVLVDAVTPWLRAERVVPLAWQGVLAMLVGHYLVVEPLYYAYHRLLHHPKVYHASHSHHHASVTTEAVSGTSHPLAEAIGYLANFSFPFLVPAWVGCFSYELVYIYFVWFDIMNCMGHCNFETVPLWLQWGPLKYLVYTGSYHSLHHSKYKYNYCLFCPLWDYLFGTVHPTTRELHARVLSQAPRSLDAVFLGHAHAAYSLFHLPWLSPYLASHQHELRWWMVPMYPLLLAWVVVCRYLMRTTCIQRYQYRGTQCATWCLPVTAHFFIMPSQHKAIADMIVEAVCDADDAGVRYFGLGALNKAEWINHGGQDILPRLGSRKIRVVHGNTLTAAAVWEALRKHTEPEEEIFVTGSTSKIGRALCVLLARRGHRVKMMTACEERFAKIQADAGEAGHNLQRVRSFSEGVGCRVWVLGKLMSDADIAKHISPGSLLVDYAVPHVQQHVAERYRYVNGAALSYQRGDTDLTFCHDVPGTVPACLAATIIHAREGLAEHELGEIEIDEVEAWWTRAESHGFRLECMPACT